VKTKSLKSICQVKVACFALLVLAVPATAQVNYAVSGGAAYVTSSPSASGNIVIASKYQGNPVIGIGYQAFHNCANLTSVTIPNSVTNIGDRAFSGCTSLTSVTMGNGVTTIGSFVFENCHSMTNFAVASANPVYSSLNGVLFNKAQTTLIRFPRARSGSYTIPNSVTHIVDSAYFDSAFFNCYKLTSVIIPNSVTSIGVQTFYACGSLTNVTIPNSVTSIGSLAFAFCSSLTNGTIPNGVTSIGGLTFEFCHSLTSVTIPDSVTSIGASAFRGCSRLTNITVAAANPVFSSLNGVLFNKAQTTFFQFPCGRDGSYVVPNSVTSIASSAFANCAKLTSVAIPDSVTNIGNFAFQICSSLTNVVIGNSVTAIRDSTFLSCTSLTSVTVPNSVTSIEDGAFNVCVSLTNVTIPNSVTNIGDSAFRMCTSLRTVTLPNSISSIGDRIFWACSNLTSVTIPNSVTNIGVNAFFNCSSLTNLTVLGDCPALEGDNVFVGVPASAKVYYYYGSTGWGTTYGGLPTVMLYPPPQVGSGSTGVKPGGFGFTLTGVVNQTIVVEASTNLADWQPIWTNTLSGVSTNFVDSQWQNHPLRFYRAQSY